MEYLEVLTVEIESDGVKAMQYSDSRLMELMNLLKIDPEKWTTHQKRQLNNYIIKNQMLYRKIGEKELWEVPNAM